VINTGAGHYKSRPMPHCRVLPPGDVNGMIPGPLPVYCGSFTMTGVTVFLLQTNMVTHKATLLVTKSKVYNDVDFQLRRRFVADLSPFCGKLTVADSSSTVLPKLNMFNLVDFVKSWKYLSPECQTSFRLCCQFVPD